LSQHGIQVVSQPRDPQRSREVVKGVLGKAVALPQRREGSSALLFVAPGDGAACPASTARGSSSRNVGVFSFGCLRSPRGLVPMSFLSGSRISPGRTPIPIIAGPISSVKQQSVLTSPPTQGTALHPPHA
jgi:hypothetical protein